AVLHIIEEMGEMGGSSMGGVLVDKWNFPAPFYMVAVALALSLPALAIMNPKRLASEGTEETGPQQVEPRTDWSYYRLLRHPLFLLNLTSIVIESLIPDFNMSTLEPYLTQIQGKDGSGLGLMEPDKVPVGKEVRGRRECKEEIGCGQKMGSTIEPSIGDVVRLISCNWAGLCFVRRMPCFQLHKALV
ncbi:hypothetical protein HPB47_024602, partial [Ixodes persulcatus]